MFVVYMVLEQVVMNNANYNKAKLVPCFWCGMKPLIVSTKFPDGDEAHVVFCADEHCVGHYILGAFLNEEDAIAAWNELMRRKSCGEE